MNVGNFLAAVAGMEIPEAVAGAEEAYFGGVADLGDTDAARLIQDLPGYPEYRDTLEKMARLHLGDRFAVWRAMTPDSREEWAAGADIGPISVTFNPALATAWGSLAANRGSKFEVARLEATPDMIVMRGKPEEAEIVIDGNQVSYGELQFKGTRHLPEASFDKKDLLDLITPERPDRIVVRTQYWYSADTDSDWHVIDIYVDGKKVVRLGPEPGGGEQHEYRARDWLIANGYLPEPRPQDLWTAWRYYTYLDIEYIATRRRTGAGSIEDGNRGDMFESSESANQVVGSLLEEKIEVPEEPGTVPIPANHLRLYHYTNQPAEVLRREGLLLSRAKGHTYGEPNMVWSSLEKPSDSKIYAEFSMAIDDPRFTSMGARPDVASGVEYYRGRGNDFTILGDVRPEELIAVHEPWHHTYRYLVQNGLTDAVLAGEYDDLTPDKFPNETSAIAAIKHNFEHERA